MFTRSIMTMATVGALSMFAGVGTAAADGGAPAQPAASPFSCFNKLDIQVVSCVGAVAVIPITVNIKDVGILNDNDLSVLSDDLNKVSILDGGILNNNKILNDLQATVLTDFLNKFGISVDKNDVDVCASVLGFLLCK
jgi:hypothetical protein